MKLLPIKFSYVNVSKNIYSPDFLNLANIYDEKINFDERTKFLSKSAKAKLNNEKIEKNCESVYVYCQNGKYGVIADLDILEYKNGNIKCHELVLPDVVQGMIANYQIYNTETSPVFIVHNEEIDLKQFVKEVKYNKVYNFENIKLFQYTEGGAIALLDKYKKINSMFIADGHHRLYATSMSKNKNTMLTQLMSISQVDILPIHRILNNIDAQTFERAKTFIDNMFETSNDKYLTKGNVRITYQNESFVVKLKDMHEDLFWNNDVYRLNTQIISTAFRVLDFSSCETIFQNDLEARKKTLSKKEVLFEVFSVDINEFMKLSDNNCILPPKATCFEPKFLSFLIFKKYF
ncbi:DUF1015 family protein [Mycoplasma sp. 1331]|uniref:DUF1015 family protein n=1 Tax=Mycoplasma tauri TaxID=547987 RepID=A0A953T3J8_9MOLU|nr:DUF1015 family protein [Mycoplasma tauri]MBZ4195148.1 DUF1015 family protein [Mycoplasma tauri]